MFQRTGKICGVVKEENKKDPNTNRPFQRICSINARENHDSKEKFHEWNQWCEIG
jgi:hypothetical protein